MAQRRLTDQQRERISRIQDRRRQRADANAPSESDDMGAPQTGRVVVRHGRSLVVRDDQEGFHHCVQRQNLGEPVCGDRVVWHPTSDGQGVVTAILERRGVLSRPDFSGRDKPLAANLDRIVVVLAVEPEPSDYLLDQYLIAAEGVGLESLIVFNKADLAPADRPPPWVGFAHYAAIGYPLVPISTRTGAGMNGLLAQMAGHTCILVGQSGVGKSSLIQALLPDQEIQVGRLSEATGLGRHTTSAATLYRLPGGGELIDSPGVRSFRLGHLSRSGLEQGFREFRPWLGQCRFRDCLHGQEPGCAIKAGVEQGSIHPRRLENFLHLQATLGQARE